MFRYIVALLLVNSYSGSWGAPAKNMTILLSMSLNELADKCESSILSMQMKNKLRDCQVLVPPYQKKQLECLLFYDINRQLCDAVATSKLAVNEDFTTKILSEQDVSQLCVTAKDWSFTDLGEVYNKTVNAVFHDPVKCFKFCIFGSDNILNVDSSFYCKYFNWGSVMLKSQYTITSSQNSADNVAQVTNDNVAIKNKINTNSENAIETEKSVQSNQNSIDTVNIQHTNVTSSKSESGTSTNVNSEIVVTSNKVDQNTLPLKENELAVVTDSNKEHKKPIPQVSTSTFINGVKPPVNPKELVLKDKTTSTVVPIDLKNKKSEKGNKEGTSQDVLNQIGNRPPIDNGDPDDYPANDIDSEEVRDGLGDTHGDDDPEDPLDRKIDDELVNKKNVKINEQISIDNNDILPKETYSNTIPDFAEEDDHFFPFFLTAIIMVVLLYILYHNKNRVSKVVLGLIVEGRQPGRRRNSRGHAYRRLDTLEQAMSTNTAAPPSKIIY